MIELSCFPRASRFANRAPQKSDPRHATHDPRHLYRYVIRPLVKSYGDNSTRTLSPGRIRMKCFRILPEMWASTLCLFSNSTWNIAFGNVSRTVPVTSIASSFDMFLQLRVLSSQLSALGKTRHPTA